MFFLLPTGWKIGTTVSNGSNWISVIGSPNIIPNAINGGVIQYYAKSDCSNAFFTGSVKTVSILRPNPTFTLSPTALTFVCGTPQTKTFTVSTSNTLLCSTSYIWNLGANNGWLYNGLAAPATITTPTNSITLTSASGNVLPAPVNVTPNYGGSNLSTLTCTTSLPTFSSTASISGNAVTCIGSNSIYTLSNLGTGNTLTWSSSNTAIATVNSPTQSQVTMHGVANGTAILTATITNPCGQSVTKTFTINVGEPVVTSVVGAYIWAKAGGLNVPDSFPAVPSATSYNWVITVAASPDFPCAASVPKAKFVSNGLTTLTTTTPSATMNFGSCVQLYNLSCYAVNSCGSTLVYSKLIDVNVSGTSPCAVTTPVTSKIMQNPIKNGMIVIGTKEVDDSAPTSNIVAGDSPCYLDHLPYVASTSGKTANVPKDIRIYDMFGRQVYNKEVENSDQEITLSDANLRQGKYIVTITKNGIIEKHIIVVE